MDILQFIKEHASSSPAFLEALAEKSKVMHFAKGAILLTEGAICRHVYYIQKGCLRFYYVDEKGNDITHWFAFEGDFMTEINSFFGQVPSEFYLETLEDCELLTFSYESMETLADTFPEFNRMEKMIYRKTLLELGEKIMDLQFRDAKTRYFNLINKHEDILLRVPLGHTASYLGVTQQSLSRIRRQLM